MFGGHHHHHHRDQDCTVRRGRWSRGPFFVEWNVSHHEGRRGRKFDSGELRLVFLRLIADRPRHGYDLISAIEERTGGAYAPSPGVVYPTLTLLEEMELIAEQDSPGTRRLYAVTPDGEAHLAERADEVAALMARLDELGAERARAERGSIRRSMSNLREALRNRLADEDMDEDVLHRIVELVDELAQKIERLK